MVELLLRENGWQATSLGSNLPFATLGSAIAAHQPKLFWISVSHLADELAFVRQYQEFFSTYGGQTAIVVGKRALIEPLRLQMRFAAHCDNLAQLETFAQAISTN